MTTYNLPKEPSGPVWDMRGKKWERVDEHFWRAEGGSITWASLLEHYGPLTDTPPVKVGDTITLEEFSKLPRNSIAGTDVTAYVVHSDGIRSTYRRGLLDREVTVLRIGDGSQT